MLDKIVNQKYDGGLERNYEHTCRRNDDSHKSGTFLMRFIKRIGVERNKVIQPELSININK